MLSRDDINAQFNQVLGRNATDSELADFQRYGSTGYANLGASDIGQILQGMPEYQQKQLQNYGGQYLGALGASDQRMLGLAQNQLTGQFAQMGRDIGGSGYINAFAQAAQNLAMQRQQSYANFLGQGYGNIMANTQGQAQNALGYGRQQNVAGVQRANQLQDIFRQRQWNLQDYQTQKNDYMNFLNQQSQQNRNSFLSGGIGSLIGGGLGYAFGGGMPGAQLGAGIGGLFGRGLGG